MGYCIAFVLSNTFLWYVYVCVCGVLSYILISGCSVGCFYNEL